MCLNIPENGRHACECESGKTESPKIVGQHHPQFSNSHSSLQSQTSNWNGLSVCVCVFVAWVLVPLLLSFSIAYLCGAAIHRSINDSTFYSAQRLHWMPSSMFYNTTTLLYMCNVQHAQRIYAYYQMRMCDLKKKHYFSDYLNVASEVRSFEYQLQNVLRAYLTQPWRSCSTGTGIGILNDHCRPWQTTGSVSMF